MMTKKTPLSLLVFLMLISACSVLSDNRAAAAFFISQGVARYIEADSDPVLRRERAAEAVRVVEPVIKIASNESFTVDQLETVFYAQFDITLLEPSDQAVIQLIVADVKTELADATLGGYLDEDARIFVRDLLRQVVSTAAMYGV